MDSIGEICGNIVRDIVVRDHFSVRGRGGGQDCSAWGPSLTDQSFAKEADVNWIVNRFMKTGVLPHVDDRGALYGDFSDVPDYRAACDIVLRAQDQFSGLDAKLRRRFNNDPSELLAFVNDPRNLEEGISLGILERASSGAVAGKPGASNPPSPAAPAPAGGQPAAASGGAS